MDLQAYLDRIGYRGKVEPTLDCLNAIHRHQALAIPYENVDVQLGRPVGLGIEKIFDKIVTNRRGGWCYELNGLLGWALREIGFDVTRAVGGVHRRERGDQVLGNHLILLVKLGRLYLADLGLGDGIREPIPVEEGRYTQGTLEFRLERLEDGFWRFHNHSFAHPPTFDFRAAPADEALLKAKCEYLQTSEESVFVPNLSCEMMHEESLTVLTGRVLKHKAAAGTQETLLNTAAELEETVAANFGIMGLPIASLWPKIVERHAAVFGES